MSSNRSRLKYLLVPLASMCVLSGSSAAGSDPAGHRPAAAPEAVIHAADTLGDAPVGEASRAHFGNADLYVPSFFRPVAGSYDLIVHFHGIASLQEDNFERAHVNAAVVSVNLGVASDAYSNAFRAPGTFDALVARAQRALDRTGRTAGAHLDRIALSAWSAGFAAVGAILKQPGWAERIDAILLADGPHANYVAPHRVNDAVLEKWARYAEAAKRGDKLFALTHSSIPTIGYPSTTDTVGELLRLTAVDKVQNPAIGPGGMREIYESHDGNFHVEGFEGQTKRDHIDHIKSMAETLLPYLRERWSR
jgi:hypothetical protein